MLTFVYTARDPATGQKVKAEVQAENEQAAAKLVRQQGLSPLDITLKEAARNNFISKRLNRAKTKDKVLFSRQLATLINAGLPLVQSLRSVASQTTSKSLKVIINKIINDVEAGGPLSSSMAKSPDVFNQVFVSVIAAGEASGTLDKALERLAIQQEKDAEILSKIRGAMIYPVIVLFVMGGVLGFMVVSVLPQVQELYKGLPGVTLPLVTRILLAFSNFIIKFWWILLVVAGVGLFFMTRWARTLGGKRAVDKFKMHAWPIGPLFM